MDNLKVRRHRSEETKEKISKSLRGNIPWNKGLKGVQLYTVERNRKISMTMTGKHHTEETKRKMSESSKGRKLTAEHKRKLSIAHKGKHLKNCIVKHHIYLRENSDKIMELPTGEHASLHRRAYNYVYKKYGEEGIDDYIKWFKINREKE